MEWIELLFIAYIVTTLGPARFIERFLYIDTLGGYFLFRSFTIGWAYILAEMFSLENFHIECLFLVESDGIFFVDA